MKPARLAVLAVAIGAAGVAALLMNQSSEPPAAPVVTQTAPSPFLEILVAGAELPVGHTVKGADLRWQRWPQDLAPGGALVRSTSPGSQEDLTGSIVRQPFLAGEPIRPEKLVKANGAGFMSAILPSGMRAVAIGIDTRGATSAGGFILPNDRVDVLRTARDDEATKATGIDVMTSQTILSNIRILAIGQNVQERNGEKVVTGDTATLEVTPSQAEMLAVAAKAGQISLALRSLTDTGAQAEAARPASETGLTVVRYGVAQTTARR